MGLRGWVRMNKKNEKSLVPKLRFPEFRDCGEWEEKPLSQLCEVNPSTNNLPDTFVYIDLESVEDGKLLKKKIISKEDAPSRAQRLLKKGDVIFQMVRPYQKNNFFFQPNDNLDYVASTGYAQLRACESNLYLFQYLHGDKFVDRVLAKCTGSNYPAINSSDLSEISAEVPELPEQQKIADCLTSLDELITAEAGKLEAYKAHKKGLMQKLFPAEGETVPGLRFPEFRAAREWKEYQFGKLIKVNSGKGFKAAEYSKHGIRLVQIENIGYGLIKWNDNTIYLPQDYSIEFPELVLRQGDIVLALNRPVTNNELKIAQLKKKDEPSLLYQRVGKLELLSVSLADDFAFHLCQLFIKKFVVEQSIGSDQPFISVLSLYAQVILIPSPKEQQRIADCLTSLDELITAQAQKIETLKAHKKGLMQGLFPSTDEVSV